MATIADLVGLAGIEWHAANLAHIRSDIAHDVGDSRTASEYYIEAQHHAGLARDYERAITTLQREGKTSTEE